MNSTSGDVDQPRVAASDEPDQPDFATVLRGAIARRGLTLARAQAHLAQHTESVSVATLSNWQSGRSLPGRRVSRDVLRSLDDILELPGGTLEDALDRTHERQRGEAEPELDVVDLLAQGDPLRAELESLDLATRDGFAHLSALERLHLDGAGAAVALESTFTLRAERDGLDSFTAFYAVDAPVAEGPGGTIETGDGCVVRRSLTDGAGRVRVVRVDLPRSLARGELVNVSLQETFPETAGRVEPSGDGGAFGRGHRTAFRDAGLEVVFHPERVPESVEQFFEPVGSARLSSPDLLRVADTYGRRPLLGDVGQSYISGRGPGVTGMRWRWAG